MKLEAHLHEWKSTGGRTWENIGLMARGAKEYSDTDLTEETMQEIFCKVCHFPLIFNAAFPESLLALGQLFHHGQPLL